MQNPPDASAGTNRLIVVADDQDAVTWDDEVRGRIHFVTLFSADRTPSSALTTGVATVPVGGWLGLHRHAPAETYVVTSGTGIVTLDGEEHPVTAGTAVHIPGGAEHGVRNAGDGPLRVIYTYAADAMSDIHYEFTAGDPPAQTT